MGFGTVAVMQATKKKVVTGTVSEAVGMVVNLNGTALVAGQTACQILVKLPGVFVDQDGSIQRYGRSGITVMLDGKSAGDLRTMLQGMAADNIKNVVIVTNPSAKYGAEGSSGILNSNLKNNNHRGMNGSLFAGWTSTVNSMATTAEIR